MTLVGKSTLRQHCSAICQLLVVSLIGLIGQRFLPRGCRLLLLFVRLCHACAAFLLVLQADKSGLMLLLPCSFSGKADLEAEVAKPKEDGC
jgi:hypothetical protein